MFKAIGNSFRIAGTSNTNNISKKCDMHNNQYATGIVSFSHEIATVCDWVVARYLPALSYKMRLKFGKRTEIYAIHGQKNLKLGELCIILLNG